MTQILERHGKIAIMASRAQMPSSCRGHYGKLALVELTDETVEPAMISPNAHGIHRIIELHDRLHQGGPHSAFEVTRRALSEHAKAIYRDAAKAAGWEVVPDIDSSYFRFRPRFWVEDSGLCDTEDEAWELCCKTQHLGPYADDIGWPQ